MFTVLLSSTSLILNKHFCSNELVSTALMSVPVSCHSDAEPKDVCPMHAQEQEPQDNCCSDEAKLLKTELNHDLHQFQFKAFQISAWAMISTFFLQQTPETDSTVKLTTLKDWNPPSPTAVSLPRIQQFLC